MARKGKSKAVAAPVEAAPPAVVEEKPRSALAVATGSDDPEVQRALISDVVGALGMRPGTEQHDQRASAAFGLLASFKPRDAVEAMLAGQVVALNNAGMAALRRAVGPDLPPEVASRLRRDATAMFRTVGELVEVIESRRGNGSRQRIVVEHVERAIFGGGAS